MDGYRICDIHLARVSLDKIHDSLDLDLKYARGSF